MKRYAFAFLLIGLVACGSPVENTAAETTATSESDSVASEATETEATDTTEAVEPAEASDQGTASEESAVEESAEKPDSYYVAKIVVLKTGVGDIAIRFFPDVAPNHVRNFIDLAESDFYDGTKFHRIIPGFVIQGGDPNTRDGDPSTWGTGGSGKRLKAEFSPIHHKRGILSMARSMDPDSASSQFFICVADAGALDNQYTVFGEVVSGMDVVDKIVSGPRTGPRNDQAVEPVVIEDATVRDATDAEKGPAPK